MTWRFRASPHRSLFHASVPPRIFILSAPPRRQATSSLTSMIHAGASSRRLSIAKFTRQIPNDALLRTPPLFVALDPYPFCVGQLNERLGCLCFRSLSVRCRRAGKAASGWRARVGLGWPSPRVMDRRGACLSWPNSRPAGANILIRHRSPGSRIALGTPKPATHSHHGWKARPPSALIIAGPGFRTSLFGSGPPNAGDAMRQFASYKRRHRTDKRPRPFRKAAFGAPSLVLAPIPGAKRTE